MNIPNKLTLTRFFTIPFVIIALYMQTKVAAYIALFLLVVAWITDILDGHLANKKRLGTKHGAFFDQFIDKILVSFAFIALGDLKIVPMWLVLLILFRDYIIQAIRGKASLDGTILKSEWSGKIKLGLQMMALIFTTFLIALGYSFESVGSWMLTAIFWVVVIITIEAYYALFDFLYKNKEKIKVLVYK